VSSLQHIWLEEIKPMFAHVSKPQAEVLPSPENAARASTTPISSLSGSPEG
jgi:hypothetical protein